MSGLIVHFFAIALVIVAAASTPIAFNIVLFGLILYSLAGPAHMIRAVALSVVLKYINPALGSYNATAGLLFWLLLLCVGLRYLPMLSPRHLKLLLPVWAFAIVAAVLSYFSSKAVPVSLMKVGTFAWVIPSILVCFLSLTEADYKSLRNWSITFSLVIVILSALTLIQPGIAYANVPGSLQGILNQPQALGIFVAPLCAWSLAGLIAMRGKSRPHEIAAAILIAAVMVLTLARTAAVAACIGVVIAAAIPLLAGVRSSAQASTGRIIGIVMLGVLTIFFASLLTGALETAVNDFILKRGNEDIGTAFYESRGWGIVSQWRNFLERPLLGNGFGVFANGEFPAGIVEWHGIPISAPVEKGFLPTALLEETGLIGAFLFVLTITLAAREVHRNTDLRWVAAFWAAIMVNLGEAVILAPGGLGLHVWLILGMCIASGKLAADTIMTNDAAADFREQPVPLSNLMR